MAGTDVAQFRPRDPERGDFRFIGIHDDSFDPADWPAEPSAYRPTQHFRDYFRRHERYITGERIREAITGNKMVAGADDTGVFYTDLPGVVYYFVVGWDLTSPDDSDDRVIVTGWPHVFNRETAMEDGRFSTRALNEIQSINGTLFNERTADHEWLNYYETVEA